jgi:hypothetical protein
MRPCAKGQLVVSMAGKPLEDTEMLPLIDMMMKAGGGEAMQSMAKQFGLSQQQAMSAVEALMPAFSVGLKRNAADPMGMGAFMQALGTGNHANYFDNVSKAFDPAGIQDGNSILGHLFGSKEVSRAVAQQAAAATGVGSEILKQMLPALASMVMGGLAKQTMGNMQAAAGMGGGNVFGDVITDMMKQYTGQRRADPLPDASANPWGKMIEDMFGGGAQQQQRQQNPLGDNPLGKIFEQMTKGMAGGGMTGGGQQQPQNPMQDNPFGKMLEDMFGGGARGQAQDTAAEDTQAPTRQNPLNDVLDEMFKTGRAHQETYQRGVESIFDQFKRGMDRNG